MQRVKQEIKKAVKGKDLVIKTNQIFYLKFPKVKDEDEE